MNIVRALRMRTAGASAAGTRAVPSRRAAVLARIALLACAIALIAGCGAVKKVKRVLGVGPAYASLKQLTVVADIDANLGNATELDVVVLYTETAAASLPKAGPEWFRQRAALRRMLAKEIAVVSLEVPAGSERFQVKLPKDTRKNGRVVLVFANYAAKDGWTPITLTPYKRAALRLQAESIEVTEP